MTKQILHGSLKYNVGINKIILAIIGPSGSGKTTMANIMAENGIPTIVSYTTRPMRDGETNGKEHWFVQPEDKPSIEKMIAYTKFGDYEYWATKSQISDICTYVIDEKGLEYLKCTADKDTLIFSIYINRSIEDRLASGVDKERCERDKDRDVLEMDQYDYVINNNYTFEDFSRRVKELANDLNN